MATIGQPLITPESGWIRFDDSNPKIITVGSQQIITDASYYGGSGIVLNSPIGTSQKFKFKGTSIRLIGVRFTNWSNSVNIKIDGIDYQISQNGSLIYKMLMFELIDLIDEVHTVEITSTDATYPYYGIDAVDLNSSGFLVTPVGQTLTSPESNWKRYDDKDVGLIVTGAQQINTEVGTYKGSCVASNSPTGTSQKFNFKGTGIRLIGIRATNWSRTVTVKVDGINYPMSHNGALTYQVLLFELTGLNNSLHTVEVTSTDVTYPYYGIDAVDINLDGNIVFPLGASLTAPEIGWNRYNNSDTRIAKLLSSWMIFSGSGNYKDDYIYIPAGTVTSGTTSLKFKIKGNKFRIIAINTSSCSDNISVKIDGIEAGTMSQYSANPIYQALNFEVDSLENGEHIVELVNNTTNIITLDAIDVFGEMIHPHLPEKNNLQDMNVGDVIPCSYASFKATSGLEKTFFNLGKSSNNILPITPTSSPNGMFYFIKTSDGLLIADRNIQNELDWMVMNSNGMINGPLTLISTIPPLVKTDMKGFKVTQSAYADGFDGVLAFDKGLTNAYGCWQISNNDTNWLTLEYPIATKNNTYTLTCTRSDELSTLGMARDWKLQACNDGVNWVDLDTRINQSGWASLEKRTYRFTNEDSYLYWRILVTAWNRTGSYGGIRELDLGCVEHNIRALKGGHVWKTSGEESSLTNLNYGSYPIDNEWDYYILNSNLNGKITAGDSKIWNHNIAVSSICLETPVKNTVGSDDVSGNTSIRIIRGVRQVDGDQKTMSMWGGTSAIVAGYRPVLEYVDSKIKLEKRPTTNWY